MTALRDSGRHAVRLRSQCLLRRYLAAAQRRPRGAPAVRFLNPPTIAQPRGYTHVVEVTGPGRIIYVAGQLGYDVSGKVPEPGDFRAPGDAGVRKSQGRARQRRRPASSMWSSSTPFSPTSARRSDLSRGARPLREHGGAAGQHHRRDPAAGARGGADRGSHRRAAAALTPARRARRPAHGRRGTRRRRIASMTARASRPDITCRYCRPGRRDP